MPHHPTEFALLLGFIGLIIGIAVVPPILMDMAGIVREFVRSVRGWWRAWRRKGNRQ